MEAFHLEFNFLEEQYSKNTLFLNEEILEVNFIPEKIQHRDQELIMLSKIFIKILDDPFSISRKVMIQGDIGLGKTLIAKKFGKMLLLSAQKRNFDIRYVHINCRNQKTSYKVLHQILTDIGCHVPQRGYSPQELISVLQEYLTENNIYLLLVLDELNYLENKNFDLIYSLSRLNDSIYSKKQYLSLITIVRDISLLKMLDNSTISTLQGNILTLKKYTTNQIIDILEDRIKDALKEGVITNSNLSIIANNIMDSGDLRKGLTIIRNAVKIAESKDNIEVTAEDIHQAMGNLIPSIQDDALGFLNLQQLILLYSIVLSIDMSKKKQVSLIEIKAQYEIECMNNKIKPRSNTQIWENLQLLKNNNLIQIKINSKNTRGRSSLISIDSIPIYILLEELNQKLKTVERSE
jgi:cell division control protein 6